MHTMHMQAPLDLLALFSYSTGLLLHGKSSSSQSAAISETAKCCWLWLCLICSNCLEIRWLTNVIKISCTVRHKKHTKIFFHYDLKKSDPILTRNLGQSPARIRPAP